MCLYTGFFGFVSYYFVHKILLYGYTVDILIRQFRQCYSQIKQKQKLQTSNSSKNERSPVCCCHGIGVVVVVLFKSSNLLIYMTTNSMCCMRSIVFVQRNFIVTSFIKVTSVLYFMILLNTRPKRKDTLNCK